MRSCIKEFQGPSVDNPALLRFHVQQIAEQCRAMFPEAAGFKLTVNEEPSKIPFWTIIILHGWRCDAEIRYRPTLAARHRIGATVAKISKLEQGLSKLVAGTLFLLAIPFLLIGIFFLRLGHLLMLGVPVFLVLALIAGGGKTLLGAFVSKFDREFDDHTLARIFAVVEATPLPTSIEAARAYSKSHSRRN